jgi:hypothetical protein
MREDVLAHQCRRVCDGSTAPVTKAQTHARAWGVRFGLRPGYSMQGRAVEGLGLVGPDRAKSDQDRLSGQLDRACLCGVAHSVSDGVSSLRIFVISRGQTLKTRVCVRVVCVVYLSAKSV